MIRENLHKLNQKIEEICRKCGRDVSEIILIAVSKNNPISAIEEARNAGQLHFGENKAQELRDKAEVKSDGIYWHFIGHLQTNKVKYAVRAAEMIHSVDSEKVLNEIDKRAANENKKQKILFEVNTSDESNKFGIKDFDYLYHLVENAFRLENVDPKGLMTMAPYTEDQKIIRECFGQLREWKEKLTTKGFDLPELSMGMTNDYEIAIEEGSTILRIGTAIFGERDYSQTWEKQ
ncbi:MAG: YggS family pyridoxal phosphate-dependent enzyme [Melioribacteraceae bacterium]|nr:YggS family pyridoxal phosphate-dependent enzyme [Melioribacteraceae bacterium]